jgi:hypothetical protein
MKYWISNVLNIAVAALFIWQAYLMVNSTISPYSSIFFTALTIVLIVSWGIINVKYGDGSIVLRYIYLLSTILYSIALVYYMLQVRKKYM